MSVFSGRTAESIMLALRSGRYQFSVGNRRPQTSSRRRGLAEFGHPFPWVSSKIIKYTSLKNIAHKLLTFLFYLDLSFFISKENYNEPRLNTSSSLLRKKQKKKVSALLCLYHGAEAGYNGCPGTILPHLEAF